MIKAGSWLPWGGALAVLLCSNAALGQQCVQPPAGLVGWWPGDGHTNDLSGNNLHGSVVGEGVTYAPGKVGLAFQFNNQNGKVLVAHNPLLDPRNALTIEAWVQPWVPPQENLSEVIYHVGQFGGGYALEMVAYFNATAYGYGGVSHGANDFNCCDALSSGQLLPVNEWYHLAIVYDGPRQIFQFYLNGQVATERGPRDPDPINYVDPPADLSIGNALAPRGGIDRGFFGLIDEARVYDRALSPSEIQAIYNAAENGVCKALNITIDVRPGDASISVNCEAGLIDVAILSTKVSAGESLDFDATTVDPLTVRFGKEGSEAAESHNRGHVSDVDGDGDLDMILHFQLGQTGLACTDTNVTLTGKTNANQSFVSSDTIRRVATK